MDGQLRMEEGVCWWRGGAEADAEAGRQLPAAGARQWATLECVCFGGNYMSEAAAKM